MGAFLALLRRLPVTIGAAFVFLLLPALGLGRYIGFAALLLDLLAIAAIAYFLWLGRIMHDVFLSRLTRQAEKPGHWLDYIRYGLSRLAFMFAFLTVLIIGFSSIFYDLAMGVAIYNPFQKEFIYPDIVMFFIDQTFKGILFDFMEVFDLDLQSKLKPDAKTYVVFGVFLTVYRMFVAFFVFALIAVFTRGLLTNLRPKPKKGWFS